MNPKYSNRLPTLALCVIVVLSLCLPLLTMTALPVIAAAGRPTKTPRATKTPTTVPTFTPTPSPTPPPAVDLPDPSLFVDAAWYHAHLIQSADRWNGGLDGASGLGTYQSAFDGLFRINLDQQFRTLSMSYSTAVAQSRAIYMNVEAARAAAPDNARFVAGVRKGADYLLAHFLDTTYGGFYWEVAPGGSVVDDHKWGYGNTFPVFALSQAYSVTGDPRYLQAAHNQLAVIKARFLDPNVACGIRWSLNRDFTGPSGDNNLGNWIHLFEGLLSYYDVVVDGAEKAQVGQLIQTCGDFAVGHMYRDQAGQPDRGYLAGTYDAQWQPSGTQAEPAHMMELAFLLSRAVERGLGGASAPWLDTAHKLVNFALAYGLDPTYHAMLYYITSFDGQPQPGSPDYGYWIWWPQTETARALLHFAVVRGWDTAGQFKVVEDFIHRYQTDQQYRGLWERVMPGALPEPDPTRPNKGHIWKTNYHYSAFFVEALRLSQQYPAQVAALGRDSAVSRR